MMSRFLYLFSRGFEHKLS